MKMYDVDSIVHALSVSQLIDNLGGNEITQAQWYNAIQQIEGGFTDGIFSTACNLFKGMS